MNQNGDKINLAETKTKKIHPFFTPKNAAIDGLSNIVTPVTPDPSCSPHSIENETDVSIASTSGIRKRKRRQVEDAQSDSCSGTP